MNPTTNEIESNLSESLLMTHKLSRMSLLVARAKNVKYTLWLRTLRGVAIMRTLLDNYDKIPARTPTKLLAWLFHTFSPLKKLLYKVEKNLRSRIY